MKSKININHPHVKAIYTRVEEEAVRALDAPQSVENAVLPIYALPKTKAHERPKRKVVQVGTGVLVTINSEYFVFTATHVAFNFLDTALHVGYGDGTPITGFSSDRFSTGKATNPDGSNLDAAVFHLLESIPVEMQRRAITLKDFDFEDSNDKAVYLAAGFRLRDSNIVGNRSTGKLKAFPSGELGLEDYVNLGISDESQFLLAFDNQALTAEGWKETPLIKGCSGGPIIKASGTNLDFTSSLNPERIEVKQLLTAIIIEQHRAKDKRPGYVLATRVNVFLGLIDQFLPDLKLKDFLENFD